MQPNQYDFIMQSPEKPKKTLLGGGGSQKSRILQIVILALIVLVVALVAMSFISKLGKGGTTDLYKLAAAQEDLMDITNNYADSIKTDSVANKAASLNAIVISQNKDTTAALAKMGVKKPAKQIALYKTPGYKKALEDAKTKGTYEEAYATLLANRIDDYRAKLNNAYGSNSGAFKQKLANYYQQVNILAPMAGVNDAPTPTPSASVTPKT